jgi:hypothetical protein
MDRDPRTWRLPQWLLVCLSGALALGIVVALATSATAFGVYNPAWDGASQLTGVATETGADAEVAVNSTVYDRIEPSETVVIVLSPSNTYTPHEQARIREYVEAGGTLVVAEDFGPVGNTLLAAVGAQTRFDGRLLRDERTYGQAPALPIAPNVTAALEAQGVSQLTLNYGTVLTVPEQSNGTVLVRSSEFSYLDVDRDGELDTTETLDRRPVVTRESIGNGTVISVSDPSLFINAMLEAPDNRAFVRVLVADHDRVVLDYSGFDSHPPLSVGLLWLRQTPLLQAMLVVVGTIGVGAVVYRSRLSGYLPGRLSRHRQPPARHPVGDRDALRAFLAERHPEWNAERLDRVIAGILAQRDPEDDDD